MSNLPEPASPGSLRVSDADRDRVAEMLREAAGQGRITFDELEERLSLAYSAKTYLDLEVVTRDLPSSGVVMPSVTSAAGSTPDQAGGRPGARFSLAIMSGTRRRGPWVVPPAYLALAIMGGVRLDLRHARFSQSEATIHAYALMGGVEIIVPEDIEVNVAGIGFMGGFDHRASGPGIPGAPRLKVIGFAMMGGVDVKRKPARKATEQGLPARAQEKQLPPI